MKKMSNDSMSKFISLILRHHPEAAYIELDEHGWAEVDKLIEGIRRTGKRINRELLEDKTYIRANQGHSVPVDVGLKEQEPPVFLYHGTAAGFLASIEREGLKPMGRLYVHLSKDVETAVNVGKRHGKPVVLKIHSGDMYRDGQAFYLSENGVWLTKKVVPEYFERLIV